MEEADTPLVADAAAQYHELMPADESLDAYEEDTPQLSDMMQKKIQKRKRLKMILEFARTMTYTSQETLSRYLEDHGVGCNQPQISKDLDSLGLAPYYDRFGVKRLGRRSKIMANSLEERYVRIFCEAVLDVNCVENYVLIETVPACGQAAAAVVEAAHFPEVLSISYGISSVTVLCVGVDSAADIRSRLKEGIL